MKDHSAYINRVLGSIHNDLGFLVDCGIITEEIYEEVTNKIPRRLFPSQDYAKTKEPLPISQNSFQNTHHIYSTKEENSKALPTRSNTGSNVSEITSKFQQNMSVTTITPSQGKHVQENNHASKGPLPSLPKKNTVSGIFYAEALYDYDGEEDEDLSLKVGDKITVLEYVNEDWWRGTCNGKEGIFPANHVKKIPTFLTTEKTVLQVSSKEHGMKKEESSYSQKGYYTYQQSQQSQQPSTQQSYNHEKKVMSNVGKKFGNAALFGAGAAVGSHIVGGIL